MDSLNEVESEKYSSIVYFVYGEDKGDIEPWKYYGVPLGTRATYELLRKYSVLGTL